MYLLLYIKDMERAHVFISGRVQGVFYRANTKEKANKIGVNGWVKNLKDGRVEAVFEGEKKDVEKMIEWCHKGSPQADVEEVKVKWEEPKRIEEFEIRY